MPMPSPPFAWAARVLFTWDWSQEKYLRNRINANPQAWQRRRVVAKALLVMFFQAVLWAAATGALIAHPLHIINEGRGGMWLTAVVCVGALFISYCVFELWVYTRRYSDDFSQTGHIKFLDYWPDWVRYVLPVVGGSNMPRINVISFIVMSCIVWALQFPAQNWDLQYLTRVEQQCVVEDVKPKHASRWGFELGAKLACADGRRFEKSDPEITALVWNDRSPVQCLLYEGGLLSCSRR